MSTAAHPPRPVPFQGDLRNLPDALAPLKELPNWVCWRWEWKVNKKGGGKWDKPPFRPNNPTSYAKNNDPSTWGTYEQALAVFEAGHCDGIGFNHSGTDIAAFDIDKCRDPATGVIAPEAAVIVDRATSYTEMTVSGTGLRVIGYGTGPKLHRKQKLPSSPVEIESYRGAERYIVITGNPLPNTWPHLADIDREIDAVVAELDGQDGKDGVAQEDPGQNSKDGAGQDDEFASRLQGESGDAGDAFLPYELFQLIERGVPPHQDLSAAFHHAVCWLGDCGWSATRIEAYIAGKAIVPERYANRLGNEIARCLQKAKSKSESDPRSKTAGQGQADQGQGKDQGAQQGQPPIELRWHGQEQATVARPWLVKDLIPETGAGLASGQWGTAKTFGMIDLAGSIMTATPFAGRAVARQGGVLFVAAEGSSEIPIRLQGIVDHKLRPNAWASGAAGQPVSVDLEKLPFAWIEEGTSLKEDFDRLVSAAQAAGAHIQNQFNLPLSLVIIDTLNAAANFKDGNDAAEGQFIMNRLEELSRRTGAFVLAVDHFGKAVETGTRGTSAKEAAADAVLAFLADRDTAGNVKNLRMAVRKLRGGATGAETPFLLSVVEIGDGESSCIIEWRTGESVKPANQQKDKWTRSLRVFRAAMATALVDRGAVVSPWPSVGTKVRAVPVHLVRQEFKNRYPGEQAAKLKAFNRSLKDALSRGLIVSWEVGGIDHLWFAKLDDETDIHTDKPDTP